VPHSSKGLLNARVSIVVDVRSAHYVMSNLLQDHHTDSQKRTRYLTTPYKKFLRPYLD